MMILNKWDKVKMMMIEGTLSSYVQGRGCSLLTCKFPHVSIVYVVPVYILCSYLKLRLALMSNRSFLLHTRTHVTILIIIWSTNKSHGSLSITLSFLLPYESTSNTDGDWQKIFIIVIILLLFVEFYKLILN